MYKLGGLEFLRRNARTIILISSYVQGQLPQKT